MLALSTDARVRALRFCPLGREASNLPFLLLLTLHEMLDYPQDSTRRIHANKRGLRILHSTAISDELMTSIFRVTHSAVQACQTKKSTCVPQLCQL